jgi:hypothetical protein
VVRSLQLASSGSRREALKQEEVLSLLPDSKEKAVSKGDCPGHGDWDRYLYGLGEN